MGRWPSADETALWSEGLWQAITKPLRWDEVRIDVNEVPRIGGDIASGGKDKCANHVSWGEYSVFHESRSGKNEMATIGRFIELADYWAEQANKTREKFGIQLLTGKDIPMKLDDDNAGGVIVARLREQGYKAFGVGAAAVAMNKSRYPNKRSELWFMARDQARAGLVKMGLLPYRVLAELHRQAFAPTWSRNSAGQRVVEPKEQTAKRLGRSPDDMDAFNLSRYNIDFRAPEIIPTVSAPIRERIADERDGRTHRAGVGRFGSRGRRRGGGLFGR